MTHDFDSKLAASTGEQEKRDVDILRRHITGCVSVRKTNPDIDRIGIDYVCTLRRGAEIYVDGKTRQKGASRFWHYGEPELAMEIWSVEPEGGREGKVGWTLNEDSPVHKILYTFDRSDCEYYYLLDFQNLRMACRKYNKEWGERYGVKRETSTKGPLVWTSVSIFVPASVVIKAVHEFERGKVCCASGRYDVRNHTRRTHSARGYDGHRRPLVQRARAKGVQR